MLCLCPRLLTYMTTKSPALRRTVPAVLLLAVHSAAAFWEMEGAFSAPDTPSGANHFGSALEMSGSTIVVGADATDEPGKADVGAVYSYERDGAGQWNLTQILRYPNEPAATGVGRTLALDGNVLLV